MNWTQRARDDFKKAWLRERMPHRWGDAAPTRCTTCGAKFSAFQASKACPKRRRPNRWRLHLQRALHLAMYPREGAPRDLGTPAYWLRQLADIGQEAPRMPELQPEHPRYLAYWQYVHHAPKAGVV